VIFEFDQDFQLLVATTFPGDFLDGDSITYTSIVADQAADASKVPKLLQISIFALNSEKQPVVNSFGIVFSNDCNVYPVIDPGNSAGWISFVSCDVFYRTLTYPTSNAYSSFA
jgi:hypothetical protein